MSKNILVATLIMFALLKQTYAQGIPDLSNLSYETRSSIEVACILEKTKGPSSYGDCIVKMLSQIGEKPVY